MDDFDEKGPLERRRFLRVPFKTQIIIQNLDSGRVIESVHSRDISLKGIYCYTEEPFPVGSPCSIQLHLTGTSSILWFELQGRVQRTDPQGMALSFDSMDLDAFIHLKNILYYNSGDPGKIDDEIKKIH